MSASPLLLPEVAGLGTPARLGQAACGAGEGGLPRLPLPRREVDKRDSAPHQERWLLLKRVFLSLPH